MENSIEVPWKIKNRTIISYNPAIPLLGVFPKKTKTRIQKDIYTPMFIATLFIYLFNHLYWSIIALQWCVSFCFITKWISYTYTYIPISPPSCVSLPPSLSHPSRWSQSNELISLCYVAASQELSILHLVVGICLCHSLTLSQLTLPPPHVLKTQIRLDLGTEAWLHHLTAENPTVVIQSSWVSVSPSVGWNNKIGFTGF